MRGVDVGWTDIDIPTPGAEEIAAWIPIAASVVFAVVVFVVYNRVVIEPGTK